MRSYFPLLTLFALLVLAACDGGLVEANPENAGLQLHTSRQNVTSARSQYSGFAHGRILPRGSWRYEWNDRVGPSLRISEPGRQVDDVGCSDRPTPTWCGGRSGTFGSLRIWIHIYVAEEVSRGIRSPVFVFAWGDDDVFEAVVLPDTPDGRDLFFSGVTAETEELIPFVRDLVAIADDPIRGVTTLSNYSGSIVR